MNDLLNNLIDRSLDNVPSVRPRVRSLYEFAVFPEKETTPDKPREGPAAVPHRTAPKPQIAEQIDWPTTNSQSRLEQPTPLSNAEVRLTSSKVETVGEQLLQTPIAMPPREPRSLNHTQAVLARPEAEADSPAVSPHSSSLQTVKPPPASEIQLPIKVRFRSAAETKKADRELNLPGRDSRQIETGRTEAREARSFAPVTSLSDVEELGRLEFSANELTSAEAAKTASRILPVQHSRLDSKLDYPIPRLQENRSTLTEQVVNVTIGRIEIRATQGAHQTIPSANPKVRTTSLDDYLSKRNNGNRGAGL